MNTFALTPLDKTLYDLFDIHSFKNGLPIIKLRNNYEILKNKYKHKKDILRAINTAFEQLNHPTVEIDYRIFGREALDHVKINWQLIERLSKQKANMENNTRNEITIIDDEIEIVYEKGTKPYNKRQVTYYQIT